MTIYLPLWAVVPISLVVVFIIAGRLARPRGDYDFFSPMIGYGLGAAGVLFWVAFFLGRWL